jgi:hypothetical protein
MVNPKQLPNKITVHEKNVTCNLKHGHFKFKIKQDSGSKECYKFTSPGMLLEDCFNM